MHQYNMGAGDHEDHGNNNNNNQGGGGGVQQVVEDGGQVISSRVMERPSQEQIQLQAAAALKCPRCDSTNTKFCYYNNYSLSQPRHFCKACKRYWTRGGTLRNVPVGGGCRKNKRFRRPLPPPVPLHLPNNSSSNISSAAAAGAASCSTSTTTSTSVLGRGSGSTAGGSAPLVLHESMNLHQFNPLFYGGLIGDHHHQISNFPFSRYDDDADLHRQQAENLGLGFSSSSSGAAAFSSNYNAKQQQIILQDHLVGNSNYPSLIGSSNGGTTSSTISSLLMGDGGGDQQKQIFGDSIFQSFNLPSFDNHHQNMHVCKMVNNGQFAAGLGAAGTSNSLINVHHHHDHMGDSINDPSSSSNSLIWSTNHNPTATNTNWLDPSSNVASSSVPSLI